MKGIKRIWELYASTFYTSGVNKLFGVVGDGSGLLEASYRHSGFDIVTARDQRIAIAAAMGYAQTTGKVAIYTASPGPGLANALIGILEAWSACVPLVIISNGVASIVHRQGAFQELDNMTLLKPVTKWCYRLEKGENAYWALQRACYYAVNGKPGPVFLEVPDDIAEPDAWPEQQLPLKPLRWQADADSIKQALFMLSMAQKPVCIAGGGCKVSQAGTLLTAVAELYNAALFTTASGRGAIDERHQLACGLIGLYATPPADQLLQDADVLFIVGSQLEETATMGWKDAANQKTIIQLDCNFESMRRSILAQCCLVGDAELSLRQLYTLALQMQESPSPDRRLWRQRIVETKQGLAARWTRSSFDETPIRSLFRTLPEHFGQDMVLVQDNGLSDMWGYFSPVYEVVPPGFTITPGEQTGLGLAMGCALGAKIGLPNASIVAVVGDGSFQMASNAIVTAAEHELGITYIVINNGGFGWPLLEQTREKSVVGSIFHIQPNWLTFAQSVGCFTAQPQNAGELSIALAEAKRVNSVGKVALIEVKTHWDQDIPIGVRIHYGGLPGDV
jgi:acetolactate synthase-1/2/3 large subunit